MQLQTAVTDGEFSPPCVREIIFRPAWCRQAIRRPPSWESHEELTF